LWSATKAQSQDVHEVRRELAELKEEIARNRVHREDFKEAMREVKEMLNKIIDKLERKADK
jgi:septal ring factor EnvC (AmiA/AmiB activator)